MFILQPAARGMVQAWLSAVAQQEAGRAADALVALVTVKALAVSHHRPSPQSLPAFRAEVQREPAAGAFE